MVAPYLILGLMGLGLFYFQNLVLLPHVHLRLLSLLIFAAALRPPLALGFALAVFLGLLQDSYGLTPFGLHLSGALILVAAARLARRHFLLANLGSQVVASLAALFLEEAILRIAAANDHHPTAGCRLVHHRCRFFRSAFVLYLIWVP